ncbi:conserved hypothetical protein [Candidatus Terasakiella magnetica]|nr:conserved hypothetical protein [Candidatus Terasakiella magnetica]
MLKVATHSGSFHADDVFAFSILKAATSGRLVLTRSRDDAVFAAQDVVFDVGGIFDPATRRFDHHMRDKPLRRDGAPYSSAGLVWQDCGQEAVARLLGDATPEAVALVWRMVDEELIRDIDLMDNGATQPSPGHVATVIEAWNPSFAEPERTETEAFLEAVEVAFAMLGRCCRRAYASVVATTLVEEAARNAADPRVIVLERKIPWEDAVFQLGLDAALYVVRPAGRDWTVSAVPPEKGSFGQRRALPEAWGGLRDGELADVSGVADATFCHPARFVCGAKSREGALALALKSLSQ